MNKKAVFLDIDGTVMDMGGILPDSTRVAITRAIKNGHDLCICTGRSQFQIQKVLIDLGFQGIVGGAGVFVIADGKELYHTYMEPEKRREVCRYLEDNHVDYSIQSSTGIVVTPRCVSAIKNRFLEFGASEEVQAQLLGQMQITETPWENDLGEKLIFYHSPLSVEQMHKDLLPYFDVISMSIKDIGDSSGEIGINGISKATGMSRYLAYRGISRDDTIAIGDGTNDFEMVEYANIGVAMGNACEDLKRRADMVTSSIKEDGIYHAFTKLGLI